MHFPPVELKFWGELACFTRPEAQVERVSYEFPTPSAARGILEAIFFHAAHALARPRDRRAEAYPTLGFSAMKSSGSPRLD